MKGRLTMERAADYIETIRKSYQRTYWGFDSRSQRARGLEPYLDALDAALEAMGRSPGKKGDAK